MNRVDLSGPSSDASVLGVGGVCVCKQHWEAEKNLHILLV